METKFTKGEWIIKNNFQVGYNVNFGDGFFTIADCQVFSEGKANAHLIAAAPEMYEMLESLVEKIEEVIVGEGHYFNDEGEKIKNLLAKARGEYE